MIIVLGCKELLVVLVTFDLNVARQVGEDSDGDSYRDSSSSDGSSDYELEKVLKLAIDQWNTNKLDHLAATKESFSSDEGEARSSRGELLFEYLERDLPYTREPLADKVSSKFMII